MPGHDISVDIETFSSASLDTGGLYKYAQAADFTVLLFAYSIDGGEVTVIDCANGEVLPSALMTLLFAPDTRLHAFNAAFEWYCLSQYFKLTEQQSRDWLALWRCTMLHSMYLGYPASLASSGAALGLPQEAQKLKTGSALIKLFCCPCQPTAKNGHRTRTLPAHEPEKWRLFVEYNRQDVVAEMEIEHRLSAFPVPDELRQQWQIDQMINVRGVAIDTALVDGALTLDADNRTQLTEEAVTLTGLNNPNSVAQLTSWLREETGEDVTTLRKTDVTELLGKDLPGDAAERVLRIRQELGKTSIKKYAAMAAAECNDGRLRGVLRFYGASRTGRWAGKLVQPQNLPRTHLAAIDYAREIVKSRRPNRAELLALMYGSASDALSQLIRTALVPAPGCVFIDADFSAIEARVIAWLAGERWVLDVFRTHGKIYEATASQMFGVPIEHIIKGRPEYDLRQKGKVATLALGYQGSTGALIAMGALKMGLSEEELPDIVSRWRIANPCIRDLWYAVENAALSAVKTGRQCAAGRCVFQLEGDGARAWLTISLPSGRKLFYPRPRLGANRWGKESLIYDGNDQKTKRWGPAETYGGKLTENIVQATARDLLAEAIKRLETRGFRVVFHVHDEVIVEEPAGSGRTLDDVCSIMAEAPAWAADLPLSADGWVGPFYTKE